MSLDVITYSGAINFGGYEQVCEVLKHKQAEKVLLVLATPGGDPHAGFRIARALQCEYDGPFAALVPRYCKSAGTLVLVGASTLYLDDMSELGPLDIQVKKNDEIVGRNSGLDIIQAVNYLQNQTMTAFMQYIVDLVRDAQLSTKVASEIASRLTTGLIEPIAAQVDPMKLAEMQRATEIAFEYGTRLAKTSGNLRAKGIARLVTGYPSHGFVIDRKEAREIFIAVHKPPGLLAQLSQALMAEMQANTDSKVADVKLRTYPFNLEDCQDETASSANPGSGGAPASDTEVDGASQVEPANDPPPYTEQDAARQPAA